MSRSRAQRTLADTLSNPMLVRLMALQSLGVQ